MRPVPSPTHLIHLIRCWSRRLRRPGRGAKPAALRLGLAALALAAVAPLLGAAAHAQEGAAPAKPTGLSAEVSHDSVTLSWDDPQDDSITGYVILRRNRDTDAQGQFSELVADTGSAATSYTDESVAAETPYTYRIKAINAHGSSWRSRWLHIDTPAAPVPDKPTGLTAAASHDSGDPDLGRSQRRQHHRLRDPAAQPRYRRAEGQFSELVADTGSAATTYTDETVAAETPYTYRIKAINAHGSSERSRWLHIDTPAAPVPDKPTGLTAAASHDSVVLTWDDPNDDGITGYVILRRNRDTERRRASSAELVADTGSAATTYTDDSVAAGDSLHLPHQGHQRARVERALALVPHRHPGGARARARAGARERPGPKHTRRRPAGERLGGRHGPARRHHQHRRGRRRRLGHGQHRFWRRRRLVPCGA